MVVGFNHNFTYKGSVYHIQTEDSGRKSPTIVTLLYRGGTILASRKTSYADITRVDNLEQVVEELMKEQHKGMLRSLKNGEFDDVIARYDGNAPVDRPADAPAAQHQASPAKAPASDPQLQAPLTKSPALAPPSPAVPDAVRPAAPALPPVVSSAVPPAAKPAAVETSLDEIILSYLMGKEK